MRRYLLLPIALVVLGACSTAIDKIAERGNQYCIVQPDSMDDVKDSLNAKLADAGAKFSFDGITCQ